MVRNKAIVLSLIYFKDVFLDMLEINKDIYCTLNWQNLTEIEKKGIKIGKKKWCLDPRHADERLAYDSTGWCDDDG